MLGFCDERELGFLSTDKRMEISSFIYSFCIYEKL